MQFTISRNTLLAAMQNLAGVVERKPRLDALSHVLFQITPDYLTLTTSDSEVELVVKMEQTFPDSATFLVGARKLLDICRALSEGADMTFEVEEKRVHIRCTTSRFRLATYPQDQYPVIALGDDFSVLRLESDVLAQLMNRTEFSMANQDVRYYLNGLMVEIREGGLTMVATDGHRMAVSEASGSPDWTGQELRQVIVPKKGVSELLRILDRTTGVVEFRISDNFFHLDTGEYRFTCKLVDGTYPDYRRVIPEASAKPVVLGREELLNGLERVSALDHEHRRAVEMQLESSALRLRYENPEQEEVQVDIKVEYQGDAIRAGFNVQYLIQALTRIDDEKVHINLRDAQSSCMIHASASTQSLYVIMPMQL